MDTIDAPEASSSPARLAIEGNSEGDMLLHRPSSARSQDVRHILTRTFGELFTREPITNDTIKNLLTTRGGEDEYHERYVNNLQDIMSETEQQLKEIEMLEKHIMQAEAKAMSADERFDHKATEGHQTDLGLPVGSNHYRSCIDLELMKQYSLLTPDRYANYEPTKISKPSGAHQPRHYQETLTFQNRVKGNPERKEKLRQSRLNPIEISRSKSLSNTKISQLNSTLDEDDRESISLTIDGSEADGLDDHIATFDRSPVSKPSPSKKLENGKRTWTEQMAVEQREKERQALQNLQDRSNYLKNPRFDAKQAKLLVANPGTIAKEINVKKSPTPLLPIEKVQVFLAIPAVITFTDYQVGKVYETTLELKNISTSLRPVRIIPPASSYFSVGLGQFPGDQGLVASGMSAHFKVRFMPDSLGEYTDEIEVQSQCNEPLVVKVVAKRPPPILTLPPVIEVGDCLVNGSKLAKFVIKNEGGDGQFCFIPKEKWPVTNFKSSVNPAMLDVAPFQIRPAIFELKHNEIATLEIMFSPSSLGKLQHDVLLLCDNCHKREYTISGTGQVASVEFVAVDGGTSEKQDGELCDSSAQKLIRFDSLNPFTYSQKSLILSNTTNVALPFEWVTVKPHIVCDGEPHGLSPSSRNLDAESAFSIEPQHGILEASGIANFKVTFAPPQVDRYHSVLHLVLLGIPQRDELELASSNHKSAKAILKDVTAIELEYKAECVPLQVALQPYAIYVNGKNLVGTTVRRQFLLVNNSVAPIVFQWDYSSERHILEVTPALGEVGPGMSADMEVSITGCQVGKVHEVLWCHVKNLDEPVALHVEFEVKGPELYIDEPDVNFGLIRFGEPSTASVTLHNDSQMPATFSIKEKLLTEAKSEFVFRPSKGEIRPLETQIINVEFYPQTCREVMTFFEMSVSDGGETRMIPVRANVQNSDICLLNSCLHIAKLFVNMPMTQTVTMINKTLLRTKYSWGEPFGGQADICSIKLRKSGELGPREQLEVEVTFTANEQVDITDVIIPCHIDGMDEPLLLSITANVEGLQVAYAIQDSPHQPNFDEATANCSLVDYGVVKVRSVVKKYLYMRNKTSIPTNYSISVKNFSSQLPTPPPNKIIRGSGRMVGLLQKTANIADPNSKSKERALIELQQQLLRTDKGLAIVVTPYEGNLAPYQELVVELALYNDMWGEYEDEITCNVGDLDPFKIKVKADVEGIPLQFQIAAVAKDPTLRNVIPTHLGADMLNTRMLFGTLASNAKSVTRTVRINNHSPADVRIDWQMFNTQANDEQLVDFLVTFGEAFPLLDAEGNELEESKASPELRYSRPPTELLPNSPDSTPAPSRQGYDIASRNSNRSSQPAQAMESADDFIQVVIREHGGHPSDKPFTIHPKQMVIPARDKGFISVTFNPESGDPMGELCDSFILGYLNLEAKDEDVEGKVARGTGYSMEPMKLALSGCIEPALLSNEFMDDEGLRFRGVASDLMLGGADNPPSVHCITSGTKVTNLTEALLNFTVVASYPFVFTRSNPSIREDNSISLKPNESSELYIDFCINPNMLQLVDDMEEINEEDMQNGVSLIRKDGERQLHIIDKVRILFSSGAIQEFPLHASLVIPSLGVSANEIDFGTCLVGQPKQKTFILKNTTRSASYWRAQRTGSSSTCDADTFIMSPNNGFLEAHIAHITKSDCLICLTFIARDDKKYSSEFTIQGILCEEPQIIKVRGAGSYDEKYTDLLQLVLEPKA